MISMWYALAFAFNLSVNVLQPRECNCPVMCFYAVRDIKKGEELLFDYINAFGTNALDQGTFEKLKAIAGR